MTREEAIQSILNRHGLDAVYIFTTGYISRTGYKLRSKYKAFYMQGSMGLAPAIGLGMALFCKKDIVVINGDGALLMSLGTTHMIDKYVLNIAGVSCDNLFHYVLDNGCYESVGGQACCKLEDWYPGVHDVIKVERGEKDDRVGISPEDNTKEIMEEFGSPAS